MSGRPCDICGASNAPFGYAPPGLRSLKPGQRPLQACANPSCRIAAEARRDAALDPFQRAKTSMTPVVSLKVSEKANRLTVAEAIEGDPQGSLF